MRDELDALAAQIRHHEARYRAGSPEIPDAVFDDLVERHRVLAERLGIAIDARPGADHTEGFTSVVHEVPMLSLDKLSHGRRDERGAPIPMRDQLEAWIARRAIELAMPEGTMPALTIEPKVDGISISLIYERGELVRAITRGDGTRGDDVTKQVRATGAVPDRISIDHGTIELRGELYWPRDAFERHNAALIASGDAPLANPRNGCAGLVKRKDVRGLHEAGLACFLYQLARASDDVAVPRTQRGLLAWLRDLGAPTYADLVTHVTTLDEAVEVCESWTAKRASLPFEIDGMVLKIDDRDAHARLGATSHHPHWGVAWNSRRSGASRACSASR
ncbi:hypothetical protein [Sandaracinus amylolyticus]|uniref:hypothetical protein n=1 Tax=Sandaracinus amylolyticus TaxID=927083 RepID=UPI001F2FECD1|nr:hypothetical protein [Sandaracinus amylolyticus]UJR80651.1 Hypothetical protein I5071_27000 [Sandaracinus amylolyticus]